MIQTHSLFLRNSEPVSTQYLFTDEYVLYFDVRRDSGRIAKREWCSVLRNEICSQLRIIVAFNFKTYGTSMMDFGIINVHGFF